MKNKKPLLLLLSLTLALLLAACGGGEKAPEATTPPQETQPTAVEQGQEATQPEQQATPTPEPPAATPEQATEEPAPTEAPPTPTMSAEESLPIEFKPINEVVDSYRSRGAIVYKIEGGPEGSELDNLDVEMEFEEAWVKADNPFGYNRSMTIRGNSLMGAGGEEDNDALSELQLIELDDTAYINLGGQWISTSRDEGSSPPNVVNVEDFISNVEDLKKVGTENVNGVKAVHYQFDQFQAFDEVLQDLLQSDPKLGEVKTTVKSSKTQGDLWIAEDVGYPVKFESKLEIVIDGTVTSDSGSESFTATITMEASTEYYDINADITIEPPEGAPQPGQVDVPGFEPGTFPLPDKTKVVSSFGGIITLESELTPDEVTSFFDEALSNMGWTKAEGPLPSWSKGDNSFNLIITPGDNGGASIVIMSGQP